MKKRLLSLVIGLLVLFASIGLAQTSEANAQATITVVNFRPLKSLIKPEFVDATSALAPHPSVTLFDVEGMPTFAVKRPVNIEINIASANPAETYRPLGLLFHQETNAATTRQDADGSINFAQWVSPAGTVTLRHRCVLRGDDGNYEFFVLIQRTSDGAIGLIDPGIKTEGSE